MAQRPEAVQAPRRESTGLKSFSSFLLPSPCLSCGVERGSREPSRGGEPSLGLCRPCRARLQAPGPGLCGRCARLISGLVPGGFLCGACRGKTPAYDRLVAAFSYEPPLDAVIGALKFRRLEYLGDELAAALFESLSRSLTVDERLDDLADIVVPVPLHWRRRLERGFNQAESIARPLAMALERPLAAVLRRRRNTRAQARLERAERLRNPRGAFVLAGAQTLAGARILLVDDVVTTAATVEAAARTLKAAGAARVLVAAVARTLAQG